jgi:hypothetical protein
MQLTDFNMINNTIKTAKYKLSQHNLQGEKSSLSVFQVARLMDTIKNGENMNEGNNNSIYFSLN